MSIVPFDQLISDAKASLPKADAVLMNIDTVDHLFPMELELLRGFDPREKSYYAPKVRSMVVQGLPIYVDNTLTPGRVIVTLKEQGINCSNAVEIRVHMPLPTNR